MTQCILRDANAVQPIDGNAARVGDNIQWDGVQLMAKNADCAENETTLRQFVIRNACRNKSISSTVAIPHLTTHDNGL